MSLNCRLLLFRFFFRSYAFLWQPSDQQFVCFFLKYKQAGTQPCWMTIDQRKKRTSRLRLNAYRIKFLGIRYVHRRIYFEHLLALKYL